MGFRFVAGHGSMPYRKRNKVYVQPEKPKFPENKIVTSGIGTNEIVPLGVIFGVILLIVLWVSGVI